MSVSNVQEKTAENVVLVGVLSTRHYEFHAVARDQQGLDKAFLDAWALHCQSHPDSDPEFMQELIDGGDVQVSTVAIGTAVQYGG